MFNCSFVSDVYVAHSCMILLTVACQASLSMGFSLQEYLSKVRLPSPQYLLDPGIKPMALAFYALAGRFFTAKTPGKPKKLVTVFKISTNSFCNSRGLWANCWRAPDKSFLSLKRASQVVQWYRSSLKCRRRKRGGFGKIPWRRKWQPAPVFLPGEFHGQRSLADYTPWGCKELDTAEHKIQSSKSIYNSI